MGQTIPEAFDHPHAALRDMLVGFDHPVGRHLKVAGNPIKLSRHPHTGFAAAPELGRDSAAILRDIGGLDPVALRAAGVTWWPDEPDFFDRPSVV